MHGEQTVPITKEDLILEAVRTLQDTVADLQKTLNEYTVKTEQRLTTVETKVDSAVGGDQPGTISVLSDRMTVVERTQWLGLGGGGLLSLLMGLLGWFLHRGSQ